MNTFTLWRNSSCKWRVAAFLASIVAFADAAQSQCVAQILDSPSSGESSFGRSIDYSQGRMIVGDTEDSELGFITGAAYIYERVEDLWQLEQKLLPVGVATDARFGNSVALSGNLAAVGHIASAGMVQLYKLVGDEWVHDASLIAPADATNRFGQVVSLVGTTLLVADRLNGEAGNLNGAVYVYERIDGTWTFITKLLPPIVHPVSGTLFGTRLDFDGTRAIISGYERAHIFERKGDLWTAYPSLVPNTPDPSSPDSVSIDGDTAVVGYINIIIDNVVVGTAYVYRLVGASWILDEVLAPASIDEGGGFGAQVDIRGNQIAVLSRIPPVPGVQNDQVRVFRRNEANWEQSAVFNLAWLDDDSSPSRAMKLIPDSLVVGSTQSADQARVAVLSEQAHHWEVNGTPLAPPSPTDAQYFGGSVAYSDPLLALGPGGYAAGPGPVYLYRREQNSFVLEGAIVPPPELPDGIISGVSLHNDVCAVAMWSHEPVPDNPQVQIHRRVNGVWTHEATIAPDDLPEWQFFGQDILITGDELFVSAWPMTSGSDEGAVHVFVRNGRSWDLHQTLHPPAGEMFEHFGTYLAVDGDWLAAPSTQNVTHVFHRDGSAWAYHQTLPTCGICSHNSGIAVVDDMIIIADQFDATVWVYRFDALSDSWVLFQSLTNSSPESGFGYSLDADAGWLLIGTPGDSFACSDYFKDPESCGGNRVFAYKLQNGSWTEQQVLRSFDTMHPGQFGYSVAIDGERAVIGAILELVDGVWSGAAYAFDLLEFCPGDIDGDGSFTELDRAALCGLMGSQPGDGVFHPAFDFNDDGAINHLDVIHFDQLVPAPGLCTFDLANAATFQLPGDGVIDAADLAILLGAWGTEPSCADVASSSNFAPIPDGEVNAADLALLLSAWGPCE